MNSPVIQRFIERVRHQARTQSKTLSVSMDEAQDLVNELALVLLKENDLLNEISRLKDSEKVTSIVIGGGSFGENRRSK